MNILLTFVGIGVMIGGAFLINNMFPNMTMGKKKAVVTERYVPLGIDAYGNIVMKKDIDLKG